MNQLSPQQERASTLVEAWLKDRNAPQVFRLFGYAGTGKTTLARHLAEGYNGGVAYACFTGKAALVLRSKGCEGASTIHSLIYRASQDPATGGFRFTLDRDSRASAVGLIVIDEVSMVGEELARDLLSFGKKVLVLGDPAQLPPVKSEGYFTSQAPDMMLTEVHRQAQDNPIIRMSMDVREGRGLQAGRYGDSLVVNRGALSREDMGGMVLGADQMLCGLNRTRQNFNSRIRELKGLQGVAASHHPTVGDRLVCLRNNREKGLLNGGLWVVSGVVGGRDIIGLRVDSLDTEGQALDIEVPEPFFLGAEKDLDWRLRRDHDEFTFGWALTVHKSQGSQWGSVLVYNESSAFRDDAKKWLYTAVTRAAEKVTVVL